MSAISNCLVKIDCVCDYIPLVSSLTNLVDLFQKCVILPFLNKNEIESNHYYKHLDQKSFFRCFLLEIPVIGNIVVSIYDFSNKIHDTIGNDTILPIGTHAIDISTISLAEIDKIYVDGGCSESSPCQHRSLVVLKDGRTVSGLDSYEIGSIVSSIAKKRINPGKKFSANHVRNHFLAYTNPL